MQAAAAEETCLHRAEKDSLKNPVSISFSITQELEPTALPSEAQSSIYLTSSCTKGSVFISDLS